MRLNEKHTIAYAQKLKTQGQQAAITVKSHSMVDRMVVPNKGKMVDVVTHKTTTSMEGSTPKTTFTASIRTLPARRRTLPVLIRVKAIDSTSRAAMTSMGRIINTIKTRVSKGGNRIRLGSNSTEKVLGIVTIRLEAQSSTRGHGMLGASVSQITGESGSSAHTLKTRVDKATMSGPKNRQKTGNTKTRTSTSSSRRGTGRRLMLRGAPSAKPSTAGTSPGPTPPSTPRIVLTPKLRSKAPGTPSSKAKTCSRSIATTVRKTSMVRTRTSTRSSSGPRRGTSRRHTNQCRGSPCGRRTCSGWSTQSWS